MSLLHRRNRGAGIRKFLLVSACAVWGTGMLFAEGGPAAAPEQAEPLAGSIGQPPPGYGTQSRTLRPVDTGRSVTFRIGSSNTYDSFAVKTNLVYWATMSPNLGLEFGLSPKLSLEISGGTSFYEKDAPIVEETGLENEDYKQFEHWLVKPELRYWLNDRFSGHFFGLHAFYADYQIARIDVPLLFEKEYFYDGYGFGGGVLYGYKWNWGSSGRWGMEFSVGVGVIQMEYDRKDNSTDEVNAAKYKKTYFGPTSAGIKLVFMIK